MNQMSLKNIHAQLRAELLEDGGQFNGVKF